MNSSLFRIIRTLFFFGLLLFPGHILSQHLSTGCFNIISNGRAVSLYISPQEFPGVQRAMGDLQADLQKVSGNPVTLLSSGFPKGERLVIAGTIGQHTEIDALIANGKLDPSFLKNAWEAYHIEVIKQPFEGIDEALVIAGSDKRGTIYGIYEISRQIGVSPWYFWADVPVKQQPQVAVVAGCKLQDKPGVQYRGIFLNDENPALYGWVHDTYGGFNHKFYGDVFELLLRLKANYLWTAMWGKAFYDDDPLNPSTADLYGIVIGTSHHEPMGRAHVEWSRYGNGPWNYQTNKKNLQKFWIEGIERIGNYEASITLGMRGDGDEAMSEETNVELLQRIVADQRKILDEYSRQDQDKELQLWALYKEVQDYYEKGMRVPDDVMLLLADDNWGNARLLPEPGTAENHKGGWGLYYHFDYVGGPRNYKWINTNQISRTWEQMNLAWQHGVKRMWLVNVGDLKPMEFPISFFLDHAWNPEAMTIQAMERYPVQWASSLFGPEYAAEIGHILTTYTRFNARRKHELLDWNTYSTTHYREFETVVNEYNQLLEQAKAIRTKLPREYDDAYYQLVLHPVEASANLNELYLATALNHLYASQRRSKTNKMAYRVQELFNRDAEITNYYHYELAHGKWNHMMSQTHIGYTYWQQPDVQVIPKTFQLSLPESAELGIAIEGSDKAWPEAGGIPTLPTFEPFGQRDFYFEIFNKGRTPFSYSLEAEAPWIKFSTLSGIITDQQRIYVQIDWDNAPKGETELAFTVKSDVGEQPIHVRIFNPEIPLNAYSGFVASNGVVSIEGEHFARTTPANGIEYKVIPQIGKTLSGVTTFPPTHYDLVPGQSSPVVEYDFYTFRDGNFEITTYLSPSLQFNTSKGLKFAISLNDEEPQVINIHENYNWGLVVAENGFKIKSVHAATKRGLQTLKIYGIDPSIVIQKIVVNTSGEPLPYSYLGPPESTRINH